MYAEFSEDDRDRVAQNGYHCLDNRTLEMKSFKKSNQLGDWLNEGLASRYREVKWLRELVSQLESPAVTATTVAYDLAIGGRQTLRRVGAIMRTLH